MQDKIGSIYEIIASIVVAIGGVLVIVYRKKFLYLQKKYFSKHKDYMNQKLLQNLENRSEESFYRLAIVIGSIFVIAGLAKIFSLF